MALQTVIRLSLLRLPKDFTRGPKKAAPTGTALLPPCCRPLQPIRFRLEDEGMIYVDDKVFRWSMLDDELNYRLF